MLKMIINADDCGLSKEVNAVIERAITQRKITSTTIMANMDDLDGAVRLYNQFKDSTSFGVHLNLTEGSPLLYSQELLDIGFYKELDGSILLNGKPFQNKLLNKRCEEAIRKELMAQISRIRDCGVEISHIDSHHHIHKTMVMMRILPRICKDSSIYKVRNIHNYMPFGKSTPIRKIWTLSYKIRIPSIAFTNWFCSFSDYMQLCDRKLYKEGDTIELMCHPGGIYPEEDVQLFEIDAEKQWNVSLISYNQLNK